MELEGKLSPEVRMPSGPLKKTITPVRELQILSPSRILLYYRGNSFNITLSKLVNSPFKHYFDIFASDGGQSFKQTAPCTTGIKT